MDSMYSMYSYQWIYKCKHSQGSSRLHHGMTKWAFFPSQKPFGSTPTFQMNVKKKVQSLVRALFVPIKHICLHLWLWRASRFALRQALPLFSPLTIPPFQEAQKLFTSSLYEHEIRRKGEYGKLRAPLGTSQCTV